MSEWVIGHVVKVNYWTARLFSLILHAPVDPFIAGQFTKLGMDINGEKIQRAYSYVNAPRNKHLEFYLVTVPDGTLSLPLHLLTVGDSLLVSKKASGFFVLDEIPHCNNLWMLATGTALGPYLSMLEQGEGLERFQKIILVHATRSAKDLSYLPLMLKLQQRYGGKLQVQTVVSREKVPGSLSGRVPTLIANGALEAAVDLRLDAEKSHVMLCGNPNMVRDTQKMLKDTHGMRKHFKHKPGHITSENYW
ncbi:ferredoxin--NADP(+) reductase [secondary endosymbiont of Ctenarytaina eucalypti]|uniref:Flavodoxin/ferredoxin--NADP reductase n=1 Tax=secondary endosymbiont of Ctenarytaina eucalypti TaxID=1199245 RepID=J3TFN6_9ENTR|nr:ferredoxin--NADP(+) reductase [secondary endosymbiont of Ctenarytaina eucalypti]AFP85087.1 flavodoxin reductase family protein [secondary endosymbiont of Ctenarytaina eucalypti]